MAVGGYHAADGADDAGGHAEFLAEGGADGYRDLAGAHIVAVAQHRRAEASFIGIGIRRIRAGRIHFDDRQVGVGVGADYFGLDAGGVGKVDGDRIGAVDYVVVGYDVALGVPDETGALAPEEFVKFVGEPLL